MLPRSMLEQRSERYHMSVQTEPGQVDVYALGVTLQLACRVLFTC